VVACRKSQVELAQMNSTGMNMFMMNYLVLITLNKITEKGLCEGKNKNAKKLWVVFNHDQ